VQCAWLEVLTLCMQEARSHARGRGEGAGACVESHSLLTLPKAPVDPAAVLNTGPLVVLRDAVTSHQQVLINMR
jgi:hypothetical protein